MFRSLHAYLADRRFRSVGLVFCIVGLSFSLWVTRLPDIKRVLDLSEGELGLALFFVPAGALLAMLASHRLNRHFGEGRVMTYSLFMLTTSLILPVIAINGVLLGLSLVVVGFFMGLTDISMNAVASVYEKRSGAMIMSTSHGFFSLGGIIGAPLGSWLLALDVSGTRQMIFTALFFAIVIIIYIRPISFSVSDERQESKEPLVAFPRGSLIWLAIIGFCIMIGEGAVADWSTVFLDQEVGANVLFTGYGYGAFSLTMTLGRFNGSSLIRIFGAPRVILAGCVLGAAGTVLVVQTSLWITIAGFALMGAGFCNVVPVLFGIAGKQPGVSSAYGIASVASAGYLGFLTGPVMIGFIGEWLNLEAAFLAVGMLALVAFYAGWKGILNVRGDNKS